MTALKLGEGTYAIKYQNEVLPAVAYTRQIVNEWKVQVEIHQEIDQNIKIWAIQREEEYHGNIGTCILSIGKIQAFKQSREVTRFSLTRAISRSGIQHS
jgi:hypothetical protein